MGVLVIVTSGTALPPIVTNRGAMPLVHAIASLLPLIDMDDDRQSRPQLAQFGAIVVEHNAHGHTLHDLGEVAGRFSGGMTLNWAPVAGARLATRP